MKFKEHFLQHYHDYENVSSFLFSPQRDKSCATLYYSTRVVLLFITVQELCYSLLHMLLIRNANHTAT